MDKNLVEEKEYTFEITINEKDRVNNSRNKNVYFKNQKSIHRLGRKSTRYHSGYDKEKLYHECIERARKPKRDSNFGLESSKDLINQNFYFKIRNKLEKIQMTSQYQWVIIIFVALDCFCICSELLIEFIELSIRNEEFHDTETFLRQKTDLNQSHINLSDFHDKIENSLRSHQLIHKYLLFFEEFFKFGGTAILGLFIFEFLVKLIFTPMNLTNKIWEFIDAIIVIASFSLNLFLIKRHHAVYSIIGLITLIR